MSIIFHDHFEANHARKWTTSQGAVVVTVPLSAQGQGNFCYRLQQNQALELVLGAAYTELWMAVLLKNPALGGLGWNRDSQAPNEYYFAWKKGANFLMRLALSDTTRRITLYLGTSNVKVAEGSHVFADLDQIHQQIRYKIADVGGSIQVYVNDALDLNYDNQDTKPGADADFNTFRFFNPNSSGGNFYIDSVRLNDLSGAEANTRPGIVSYTPGVVPTGDSATNNTWTQNAGGNKFGAVDETPPNDDTDYVSSLVNGQLQGHTFPALVYPPNATSIRIIDEHMVRKDTSGQIDIGLRLAGVESYLGVTDVGVSYGVASYRAITKPGGGAWGTMDNPESIIKAIV